MYGLIVDNSNSVASLGWNYITNQDISLSCETSEYRFVGISSMNKDLQNLQNMESNVESSYNLWHKL